MTKILLVGQEKGGVGKSLITRGLAEAVPDAPIIEIDSTHRLIELERRVSYFPMRAERAEIERTGGKAARGEFDDAINAIASSTKPTIVDIGANTSRSLLTILGELAPDLTDAGIELGLLVVVTNEPGALAEAPRLLAAAKPFAARFVLENRLHGSVGPGTLAQIVGRLPVSVLEEFVLEEHALPLLQGGGLASVPLLDAKKLNEKHGIAQGARIRRDLTALRLGAMQAVRKPAEWLVGGLRSRPPG